MNQDNKNNNYYDDEVDYTSITDKVAGDPFYAITGDGDKYHVWPFYSYETLVTLEDEDGHKIRIIKSDLYDWYDIYDYNMNLISQGTYIHDEASDDIEESLTEAEESKSLSREEEQEIIKIFEKNQKRIVISKEHGTEQDDDGNLFRVFIVECDNSNALIIGWTLQDLDKYCEPLNIGYDKEANENGFYGKTYIFYKYIDDENLDLDLDLTESNDINKEPDNNEVDEEANKILSSADKKYQYMMLGRLASDFKYLLGAVLENGKGILTDNIINKTLWFHDISKQADLMRKIYNGMEEKPEWLTIEDIDSFEKTALEKRQKNESLITESVEDVKKFLQPLITDKGTIRPLRNDEKLPRGVNFKSGTGTHGEIRYKGTNYAYAIVDGKLKVMTSIEAGPNWSETIYKENKALKESSDVKHPEENLIRKALMSIPNTTKLKFDYRPSDGVYENPEDHLIILVFTDNEFGDGSKWFMNKSKWKIKVLAKLTELNWVLEDPVENNDTYLYLVLQKANTPLKDKGATEKNQNNKVEEAFGKEEMTPNFNLSLLNKWIDKLNEYAKSKFPDNPQLADTFAYKIGSKYIKVHSVRNGKDAAVFAFVDADGNIYKPAGWNAPAKGVGARIDNNPPVDGGKLYASKGKPVNELFSQRNFSTVPLVDKFDFVNQMSNGLPGIQPMNKFIQALNDIKLDKFKVPTNRFGTNISYADIKDEWMDINRNGWTIGKEWDSSLQGFNQIYLCVKNTSEENKEVTEGKEAMGKVSTNCAYCGSINKVNVIFPAHNKPFNTIDYVCTKCRKRNKLTDEHKYNKDGTLKESTNPLQDYETVIFENTACRERRPTRPGEAKNDIRKIVFSATSDLDAMHYVISLLGDYEEEEAQEEYPDIESCKEYFQYKDWSDGSPFTIYIKQGNKYLFDSGTTVDELADEYEDCDYDDDYGDDEVVATYYFGYVGGSAGNYYDGAKFQIIEQDGEYIAKIDDDFYTEYDTYFTEEEAYNAAIKAITPDDGSELIVDKNSDSVEIQCHDEDRENLDENTSAKVNRDKKPLKEDKELIWEITFHLPYYDMGDSFDNDDLQYTRTKVLADSKELAKQYGEQFIRSKQKSKTGKIWEDATIHSIIPFVED